MSVARFGLRTRSGQVSGLIQRDSAVDSDALAFINAIGTLTTLQQDAIYSLVGDLKFNSLWTKMKAIYPFIGGTASAHKFNLKDPQDTNGAFRLTFSGGWTHSSNGALPNGSNGYANTFLAPNGNQTPSSAHLSIYSRTSAASTTAYGAHGVQGIDGAIAIRRGIDNQAYVSFWVGSVALGGAQTNGQGLYLGSRIANNDLRMFKNGSQIGPTTTTVDNTNPLSSFSYFLGTVNNVGTPNNVAYDNKEMAFASIGAGLTSTEASNLYTIVQNFNTTLSRQV